MRKLLTIKGDLTYHHEKIPVLTTGYWNKTNRDGYMPYSIDLTTATDRIPAKLTSTILGEL